MDNKKQDKDPLQNSYLLDLDNEYNWDGFLKGVNPLKDRQKASKVVENVVQVTKKQIPYPSLKSKSRVIMSLEESSIRKIRRGVINIEGILDLHGMTLEVAFDALEKFLEHSFFSKKRYLLVITGKSNHAGERATIRSSIKSWIESSDLINLVQAISGAADCHGGSGALYIKLR
jgi:DNA-nicking Smr family endonuclease